MKTLSEKGDGAVGREFAYIQRVERSILTEYRETLWQPFCRAVKRYRLIEAGGRYVAYKQSLKSETKFPKIGKAC